MEMQKYDLNPEEQLAVANYMKSMNKSQAAREAGFLSAAVFNKPAVKEAINDLVRRRAERLLVGSDWVLNELVRVYHRCMSLQDSDDPHSGSGGGVSWDSRGALQALSL
ncbi:hypothetical protein G8764_15085 [Pseudomaricurvus alcaniphilus]|uniref:terminase small subunit n=1 Tax=Pseudomaricurvus alcaniphilus TaxID=1166482 RepID=UPI001407C614|nr:terminase small subunit [Pseudomaricurvus alcaniphilus]NHN38632.1 hypothetical protein [Pseudomaricurvus alcaniphilus]